MRSNRFVLTLLAAFTVLSCEQFTAVREIVDGRKPVAVAIAVSASELDLVLDEVKVLGAWLIDVEGKTVSGTPEWSSSDPDIATIESKGGVVTAIGIGTATMTASFGELRATVIVSVRPPNPPETFAIHLAPGALIAGGSDSLAAQAYDSVGRITAAFPISWESSDTSVATIDARGVLVGIGPGATTVTATVTSPAGTISASVTVPVIALTTSLSFARWTPLPGNKYSTDVFTFSPADQETRLMERVVPHASMATPNWSTDGSSMTVEVISEFFYDESHFWEEYNSNVYLFTGAASGTSAWRALTANGLSKSPSLSPDGTRVAYLQQPTLFSDNDIYVMNVGMGDGVRVTNQGGIYGAPIWSPDGTRLVFSAWVTNPNYLLSNYELFMVNADGSGLVNLTGNLGTDFFPSWSPDGNQIAFVSFRQTSASNPHSAVYVMNTNGGNVRLMITARDFIADLAWSPDGRQIAYSDGGSLYVMNADGSFPARLTRPAAPVWDRTPSWKR